MKLYEIPKQSQIRADITDGQNEKRNAFIIFHHIDGAYSYCTVEGKENEVCHISANQEVRLHKDGYYELV